MNKLLIVLGVACSFSVNAMDVSQANEAVSHAERNYSTSLGSYKDAAHQLGSGVVGSPAESQLNDAAAARSQAYTDQKSAILNQKSQEISNYGIKTNSVGNPDSLIAGVKQDPTGSPVTMMSGIKNDPTGNPVTMMSGIKNDPTGNPVTMISGIKNDPTGNPVTMVAGTKVNSAGHSVINVSASTLSPSTKVKTDKGIVTVGTLPKNTQVSVPFDSAFNKSVKGGNSHDTVNSHGEHETGNGSNNAANSHSAHGLGGSESIGGGHSGGSFHY
ncbi:MAG TPA: hypothetical protein VJY99_18280 [Buttiauxella sp.]|uniref:hypothetical protein n=1 Tax=Buttiauxella sp. TaxID=1972222 RepID=UPI002B4908C7|nr:hypothetical protein [Buttiauxella sp.]HKM98614.1 hypothetical protein [Buttiauxella sp.]